MNPKKCPICRKPFDGQEPKDSSLNIHIGCRNVAWIHSDRVLLIIEEIFKTEEDHKYYAKCENIRFPLKLSELKRAGS